ncbi:11930_t:CDS:2, partial [Dentiscutata erythropus]
MEQVFNKASTTQLINEITVVLTEHNNIRNIKSREIKFPDLRLPEINFPDIQILEIDFFDIIETIGKIIIIGIVSFLISYCLIIVCAHYLGFGDGIVEESIATGSQRTGATGVPVPDKRILIAVTVALFMTCL